MLSLETPSGATKKHSHWELILYVLPKLVDTVEVQTHEVLVVQEDGQVRANARLEVVRAKGVTTLFDTYVVLLYVIRHRKCACSRQVRRVACLTNQGGRSLGREELACMVLTHEGQPGNYNAGSYAAGSLGAYW